MTSDDFYAKSVLDKLIIVFLVFLKIITVDTLKFKSQYFQFIATLHTIYLGIEFLFHVLQ